MTSTEIMHGPTQLYFANDILLLVNGNNRCLRLLMLILIDSQIVSGQEISVAKSKIFRSSIPLTRRSCAVEIFGFKEGKFPETYLGIPLMQGKVTKQAIFPLIEKIKNRANNCTCSMISFQGWVTLAKSVLNNIPIHNMAVYKWPHSLIKEGDNILRNFIWTGDPIKRKGVTLKWGKVCKPIKEGGLGVCSLGEVNNAMLCKLHWVIKQGTKDWALFLKSKFSSKTRDTIHYHKPSTIWFGIQTGAAPSKPCIGCLIGHGKKIDFWRDTWATEIPLMEYIKLPRHMWKLCTSRLNNFISPQGWQFPNDIHLLLLALGINVQQL
ncbi:hypothetical protein GIB67_028073 [Kingdonia uniflora]|uniref:Uncharacterized protein n=1 Tax=Kingdonia uniflora TaxID=39325 RepID=A0A7J7L194_9MAGN|nr:hypothetical protein GIB67_028073 [Kingdonia uniflora]